MASSVAGTDTRATRSAGRGVATPARIAAGNAAGDEPVAFAAPMSKLEADEFHIDIVEDILESLELQHLRVRKRGSAIMIESGPQRNPIKHFRLQRDTAQYWLLDIADHRGRWDPTPHRDLLGDLVRLVAQDFPWVVADVFRNPERTSDPRN